MLKCPETEPRLMMRGKRRLSLMLAYALRGAAWSRHPGWGGRHSGCISSLNLNLVKVVVFGGGPGKLY